MFQHVMFLSACWNSSSRRSKTWWKVPAELWEWGAWWCCGEQMLPAVLNILPVCVNRQAFPAAAQTCSSLTAFYLTGEVWEVPAEEMQRSFTVSAMIHQVILLFFLTGRCKQSSVCSSMTAQRSPWWVSDAKLIFVLNLFSPDMCTQCHPQDRSGKTHLLGQKDDNVLVSFLLDRKEVDQVI